MPRLLLPLVAVTALASFASASVKFTSPKPGASLKAGTAVDIKWEDDGDSPKLSDLATFSLFLCAGGNEPDSIRVLLSITTQGAFAVGNAASGLVGNELGEDTPKNAYFIKMIAVGKTGGELVTYSDRFSYSGMKAKWPADDKFEKGLENIDGTTGPDPDDKTVKPGADPAVAPEAGDFDMEYTMQTGLTRYAPMQPIPPKTITAKDTKPLYPTSSVNVATTRMPIPKIQKTITQSQTFLVSSKENTAAPAPHATDDMAKFLNRWKD